MVNKPKYLKVLEILESGREVDFGREIKLIMQEHEIGNVAIRITGKKTEDVFLPLDNLSFNNFVKWCEKVDDDYLTKILMGKVLNEVKGNKY